MKKILFSITLSFLSVLSFGQAKDSITTDKNINSKLKVQVYYFHLTNRCHTCMSIESELRKTIDSLFKTELDSGIIRFAALNCELPENADLAKKYDAYGATLALTEYRNSKEIKKEDITSWAFSKVHFPEVFSKELKQKINEFLK